MTDDEKTEEIPEDGSRQDETDPDADSDADDADEA
jgi:hypothetical protein